MKEEFAFETEKYGHLTHIGEVFAFEFSSSGCTVIYVNFYENDRTALSVQNFAGTHESTKVRKYESTFVLPEVQLQLTVLYTYGSVKKNSVGTLIWQRFHPEKHVAHV